MISFVSTIYNEEENIEKLLKGLLNQTQKPTEVIFVDGGSIDKTVEILCNYHPIFSRNGIDLKIDVQPGANIAKGRNIGISQAKNEIIVVTDAGCILDTNWIKFISGPLLDNTADLVGGFFKTIANNRFQRVLADLTVASQPPKNFMPSSRSIAFTKALWKHVGGYPEWLQWGEDTLFNKLCLDSGARYITAPEAIVHWEVRPNLKSAIKQFYRYALGDGQAAIFGKSLVIVQIVYWSCIALVVSGYVWGSIGLFLLFHLGILLKRSGLFFRSFPIAFFTLAGIQSARFYGYVRGLIWRFFHGRRV